MIGQTISHYKILEKLGEGGMGVVYKAQDLKLDRFVALKFLPPHLGADEAEKQRFIQEAKAASALDHTNIANIHNIDETADGQIFICMAYYEGESIKDKIDRGPLPLAQALDFATQVAQGLAKVHAKGIVHRDIKPANIMVTNEGIAKICDFGIAKLASMIGFSKMGTTIGTPAYVSPEQARGKEVDHRADIWSLGVLLYEMLTGKLPFREANEQALMYAILHEEPEPITALRPEVPVSFQQVVAKAMAKKPHERYLNLEAMLRDLRALQKELQLEMMPASLREKPRSFLYIGAAILLVLTLAGAIFLWQRKNNVVRPGGKKALEDVAAFEGNRIAVLPFANISSDAGDEFLADGMTDELISTLSRIRNLTVIARTSVMRYKESTKSIAEIGQELKVEALLEGSIRKAESRLRIGTRLLEAATEKPLWSQNYDLELKDVFAIQVSIARQVAEALELQLQLGARQSIERAAPATPEAYTLYLQGRYFWYKRSPEGLLKSLEYFNEALEQDSIYAKAHAGLADGYTVLAGYGYLPPREAYPKIKAAAERALAIDDSLAEAYACLFSFRREYDWNWLAAEKEIKHAIALNSSYATAYRKYAEGLASIGRFDDAIARIKRAQELDPFSLINYVIEGVILYTARQYDQASEQLQKTLAIDPSFPSAHWILGRTYLKKSRFDDAINEYQQAKALSGGTAIIMAELGYAYAASGRSREAQGVLDDLMQHSQHKHVSAYDIALIHVGLGQKDQAFEWLQKAYVERSHWLTWLKVEPLLDSLRENPKFIELIEKVGLEN